MDFLNKKVWPDSYVHAPHKPEWVDKSLAHMGGYNPLAQPNWRITWGMDAKYFQNGEPDAVLYQNPRNPDIGWACWMLETYVGPDFFRKDEWEAERYGPDVAGSGNRIDYLGPFPSRGSYILVAPLMDMDYVPHEISQRLLEECEGRIKAGFACNDVNGLLEITRRQNQAKIKAKVNDLLDELVEEYEMNKDKVNTFYTRHSLGMAPRLELPTADTLSRTQGLFTKDDSLCQPPKQQSPETTAAV